MVQQGQIVPAGGPLLEVVPTAAVEVRLGVEPGTVLREGQVISVTSATRVRRSRGTGGGGPPPTRDVRRVSPDTRLVDAFVSLPKEHGLPLDLPVVGRWTDEPVDGYVVPRSAALPTDEGFVLFALADGHAKRHPVTILAEEGNEILVKGADLHPGDQVVVVGNFELTDGMAVEVGEAEAEGAATKPATAPASTRRPRRPGRRGRRDEPRPLVAPARPLPRVPHRGAGDRRRRRSGCGCPSRSSRTSTSRALRSASTSATSRPSGWRSRSRRRSSRRSAPCRVRACAARPPAGACAGARRLRLGRRHARGDAAGRVAGEQACCPSLPPGATFERRADGPDGLPHARLQPDLDDCIPWPSFATSHRTRFAQC